MEQIQFLINLILNLYMHPFNWPLRYFQRFNYKQNLNSNRKYMYVHVGTLTSSSARTQSIGHLHVQDGITY